VVRGRVLECKTLKFCIETLIELSRPEPLKTSWWLILIGVLPVFGLAMSVKARASLGTTSRDAMS
jgi:hypothetical protein